MLALLGDNVSRLQVADGSKDHNASSIVKLRHDCCDFMFPDKTADKASSTLRSRCCLSEMSFRPVLVTSVGD